MPIDRLVPVVSTVYGSFSASGSAGTKCTFSKRAITNDLVSSQCVRRRRRFSGDRVRCREYS